MPRYILNRNTQPNGDNEVHNLTTGCAFMPLSTNQIDLGMHSTCQLAVSYAKQIYRNARINGCAYCVSVCHTT